MSYEEWKQQQLDILTKDMYLQGFTPEYIESKVIEYEELFDTAYSYGLKENEDGEET